MMAMRMESPVCLGSVEPRCALQEGPGWINQAVILHRSATQQHAVAHTLSIAQRDVDRPARVADHDMGSDAQPLLALAGSASNRLDTQELAFAVSSPTGFRIAEMNGEPNPVLIVPNECFDVRGME